jgi:hypothetical protein
MDFVAQAYGAAIAAGVMPKPDEGGPREVRRDSCQPRSTWPAAAGRVSMTPGQAVQERVAAHPSDELACQWHDFWGASHVRSAKPGDWTQAECRLFRRSR